MTYHLYNKSSFNMSEIPDNSVHYVITSPPYNIGHKYESYTDNLPDQDYITLMQNVFCQISDKLMNGGIFICDIADIIIQKTQILFSPEWITEISKEYGLIKILHLKYNLLTDEKSDDLVKWQAIVPRNDYKIIEHSSCSSIVVFRKKDSKSFNLSLQDSYYPGIDNEAFWSNKLIYDILSPIDCHQKIFLDPFMGSGTIGIEIVKRGGMFFSYEIVKSYIESFEKQIDTIAKNE